MAKASTIPSVWTRQEQREQDQPALSRDAIVRVAIDLLDAEGIEALSMRKLGAKLNAGATSLYRHVATKDELMELAVDEVFGEMRVPEPAAARTADSDGTAATANAANGAAASGTADGWRAAVAAAAAEFRATALRHPWLASVLGQAGLAYLGPKLMAYNEWLAALFADAGFTDPAAVDAMLGYVIGMSTTEAAWLSTVARSGESEAAFVAKLMPAAAQAVEGHEHLEKSARRSSTEDPATVRDKKFADGLDIVLDGLALRLAR
jgi:AcrR family transcriptional regulator